MDSGYAALSSLKPTMVALLVAGVCVIVGACGGAAPAGTRQGVSRVKDIAPTVTERLLDTRGLAPCAVLSREQLGSLGLNPDSAEDRSTRYAGDCRWDAVERRAGIGLLILGSSPLQRVYDTLAPIEAGSEFNIDGYPAIRDRAEESSICAVYVGVAEAQVVAVQAHVEDQDPPISACEMSRRGAAAVIDTLRVRS